ncbi:MAG: nucleotidyl transferase AbiEii/AbiGii toxin family protein [Casimicrobiaceae bacterium]
MSTICAERTFWEKAFILHGHHCRYRDEEVIPVERNRLSRHYYDVAMLYNSPIGNGALADQDLMAHVREHNQLAFPRAWRKYDEGKPGSFLIVPQPQVKKAIEADYDQMQSMVFGDVPSFAWVHDQLEKLHARLNTGAHSATRE